MMTATDIFAMSLSNADVTDTTERPLSWEQRFFKGNRVWVETDDGKLVVEDGRVPMRYQDDDDAKIYRASPRNISSSPPGVLDDSDTDTSPEHLTVGTKPDDSAITTPDVPDADGPLRQSTTVPDELLEVTEPDDGIIEIHTDGACSGNPGPCGYGVVVRDGFYYREFQQYIGHGTNNIAELMAIKVALQSVTDRSRPIRLYTDSRYCIGVLTKGWKAKANRQLILSIRDLIDEFDNLELRKIKGHAGKPLNERADTLATRSLADAG